MHFRGPRVKRTSVQFYIGEEIEMVDQYRYLGTLIDSHLSGKVTANELSKASSRAFGCIIGKTRDNFELNYSTYIYETCVCPVADYAAGTWSMGASYLQLDKIEYRAIRYFCGLPRTTSLPCLIGEMGDWMPGMVRRDVESVRLYNQLVKMPPNRIARRVFNWDLAKLGSWTTNINDILRSVGKSEYLESKSVVSVSDLKVKLKDMYEQTWLDLLEAKPKLRTYRLVKDKLETEAYLKVNMNKYNRFLISRLRSGVLSLKIESGRFQRIPADKRICEMCGVEPETEFHFLFNCGQLKEVRNQFEQKIPFNINNQAKLLKTLGNMPHVFRNFIKDLWNKRTQVLSNTNCV